MDLLTIVESDENDYLYKQKPMLLKNIAHQFLKTLQKFDYSLQSTDHIWQVLFKNKAKEWHYLHISKYRETYFISDIIGEHGSLKVTPSDKIEVAEPNSFGQYQDINREEEFLENWSELLKNAFEWMVFVEKDWVKANLSVQKEFPLTERFGVLPKNIVQEHFPKSFRLDTALGKTNAQEFVQLVETGHFMDYQLGHVETMTAAKFFDYCKIAYIAGKRPDKKIDMALSGKALYQIFADGRHEGLLDIDPHSETEFSDWLAGKHPKKTGGGHPWEIKRGGSFTQINLRVSRPDFYQKDKFKIELSGHATNRLVETIKMFMAIYKAGLPIAIDEADSIRKRLLLQDNIGIIPAYASPSSADQHFMPEELVFEVMYFEELSKYTKELLPFIRWESLPILKLRNL